MKILVVGSGGREHALAWKLKQSSGVDRIFCAPGNAGTQQIGDNVPIPANDISGLTTFAKTEHVDLTVVGPDDPLAAGIVDAFEREKLRVFGPTKSAARLESSKIFAKRLMQQRNIPTARAGTFSDAAAAFAYCETLKPPFVIKADGLALGKGVIIAPDLDAARSAISSMINEGRFGDAGRSVVVEEFLRGTECSLHALVSRDKYQLLATARDHKRAFDGDKGPNTGGMGAVSPADTWNEALTVEIDDRIMRPLLEGLRNENVAFHGLLFPGLMIVGGKARVLEFNCRFGDPETQVILPRLKSDLVPLLEATIDGSIDNLQAEWDTRPAVTVVMASGGYPDKYETGKEISGLDLAASLPDVQIFHAGTRREGERVLTSGGRVLAVTALGDSAPAARGRAYDAVARIEFEGAHYRRDIALANVAA